MQQKLPLVCSRGLGGQSPSRLSGAVLWRAVLGRTVLGRTALLSAVLLGGAVLSAAVAAEQGQAPEPDAQEAEAQEGDAQEAAAEESAAAEAGSAEESIDQPDGTAAAAVNGLDPELIARAEAAAELYLSGAPLTGADDPAVAAQAASVAAAAERASELEAVTEQERRYIELLDQLLSQSEEFLTEDDGRRAGEGFLAVRGELEILEEDLRERIPQTVAWLESRVAALAPRLLEVTGLALPIAPPEQGERD